LILPPKHLLVIGGANASGKSDTALAIAMRLGEFVLIADRWWCLFKIFLCKLWICAGI